MAEVLIVDDDPSVLRLFGRYLESKGHQVLRATNGSEAVALLGVQRVDVVITDLRMPGLDGFGVLAYVRSPPVVIPAIVVSGAWTTDDRRRAEDLGAARIHAKPVDLAQLAHDVDELVRMRA